MRKASASAVLMAVLATVPAVADALVPSLEGAMVDPLRDPGAKAVVLLFTRSDCPISNRYAPEVQALSDKYGRDGVRFWLVYVDPHESDDTIRKHVREYGYRFGALVDRKHQLVALTKATVTPEVAVYSAGQMIYRGRIDDLYLSFGKARQAPGHHDLADVLEAMRAGKTPAPRTTRAVGCFIEDLK